MVRRDGQMGKLEWKSRHYFWEGIGVRTSAGFEGVGTEGENVGGEAGLEEGGFVGRYSGGGRPCRSGHRSSFPVERTFSL